MQSATSAANFSPSLIAKCGFLALSRAIGFGIFGLMLNLILLVAAWPEIGPAIDIGHAAHTSLGAVILLARLLSPPVFLGFLLLMLPVVYFILGQKHGVGRAVHFAFSQNRDYLMQTVLGKFREFVEARRLLTEGRVSEQVPVLLETYLKKMDNLPKPIAWLAKRFMQKAKIVDSAKAVAQRPGAEQMNLAQFLSATADELGASVGELSFRPTLTWFWIVLAVNLGVFTLLKINY